MFPWIDRGKTFRPIKKHSKNPHRLQLQEQQLATLHLGNMREAVKLPEGEDINEWYAVNIADFFNQLSMLYMTITEFCTPQTCPKMSAGGCAYLWKDGKKYKNATELPAPEYISLLFDWLEQQLDDETVFPSEIGVPFPKNFETVVREIMRRLFRVYAHCYHQHRDNFEQLGTLAHLNTSFKQFVLFNHEFDLIPKEQLAPLKELIDQILAS